MTTRDQARRTAARRSEDERRAGSADWDAGRPRLHDMLAAAREAKGVDLYRAERDTKIRARYLAALERGDYAALPGTVYTKGFLRNYAQYLGLNADEVLDQWRRERGSTPEQRPTPVVPRSVTMPRQGITLSFSMLAVVLLVVVAGSVTFFLGTRLISALQPSVIGIDHPASAVETVASKDTSYVLSGTASPGATVVIKADGSELEPIVADSTGHWRYEYNHLHLGVNVFQIQSTNPGTLHASETIEVKIIVPTAASPAAGLTVTLTSPQDNESFQSGTVPIAGTTTGTGVTVATTYLGPASPPPPSGSPNPSASPAPTPTPKPTPAPKSSPTPAPSRTPLPVPSGAPGPVTIPVGSGGSFSTSLQLPPGKWDLAITATNAQGGQQTIHRTVNVPPKGVTAVLRIKGGSAWIKVARDGVVDKSLTRIYKNGETVTITANGYIDIRTGIAAYTYVTVNGVDYGQLSPQAKSGSWRFYPTGAPEKSLFV